MGSATGAEKGNEVEMTVAEALEHADRWHMPSLDTAAHGVLADEVRRLRDLLSAAKWPEAPDDRRAAQAEGKHPAPCARFCEANAFEIELRSLRHENERLKAQLMGPNKDYPDRAR